MPEKKTLKTFAKEYKEMPAEEKRTVRNQSIFWLVLILGPVFFGLLMYFGIIMPID